MLIPYMRYSGVGDSRQNINVLQTTRFSFDSHRKHLSNLHCICKDMFRASLYLMLILLRVQELL